MKINISAPVGRKAASVTSVGGPPANLFHPGQSRPDDREGPDDPRRLPQDVEQQVDCAPGSRWSIAGRKQKEEERLGNPPGNEHREGHAHAAQDEEVFEATLPTESRG